MMKNVSLKNLLDPREFREIHIEGALNLPLDKLNKKNVSKFVDDNKEICLICKSGIR